MSSDTPDPRQNLLRQLPSVNDLLRLEQLAQAKADAGHALTVGAVRQTLSRLRGAIASGERGEPPGPDELAALVLAALRASARPSVRHVINATGVIIHTGLGRSVLPEAALRAIAEEARGYCALEIDRETGQRGRRDASLEKLLCELTGAEAATVVNNNAAATLLSLNTLARNREVVVSRGQLVEIGGSFRIPDVMAQSGARLREVGATNRTRIADYAEAVSDHTGLLLRVHPSNFKMVGFTEQASLVELVALGRERHLPVMDDIGSGALIDLAPYGFPDEPTAPGSIREGADVVCFSADKLTGGCQGGLIIGRAEHIREMRANPLYRALRVGKLTLVVLETTLRLFLDPEALLETNPTLRMMTEPLDKVARRAQRIARAVRLAAPHAQITVAGSHAQVGSGSLPAEPISTKVVALRVPGLAADELARRLRLADPPVFSRIRDHRVLLDARTVLPGEASLLGRALAEALAA